MELTVFLQGRGVPVKGIQIIPPGILIRDGLLVGGNGQGPHPLAEKEFSQEAVGFGVIGAGFFNLLQSLRGILFLAQRYEGSCSLKEGAGIKKRPGLLFRFPQVPKNPGRILGSAAGQKEIRRIGRFSQLNEKIRGRTIITRISESFNRPFFLPGGDENLSGSPPLSNTPEEFRGLDCPAFIQKGLGNIQPSFLGCVG